MNKGTKFVKKLVKKWIVLLSGTTFWSKYGIKDKKYPYFSYYLLSQNILNGKKSCDIISRLCKRRVRCLGNSVFSWKKTCSIAVLF